jgi:hypothetical protein
MADNRSHARETIRLDMMIFSLIVATGIWLWVQHVNAIPAESPAPYRSESTSPLTP